ncbi:hypothetical protein [Sulfurovum sp. AR]|uniref:hypothetical protein n=1 Tax=Sulfurovum sp. AR TaxID=1165841 RepID=UPI00025C4C3F|nr:hypothetical protein [Sulfurovum sp. AR]EIF51039.1 hypothetical protein SULAR_06718 [Sulfurovum sp. AR]
MRNNLFIPIAVGVFIIIVIIGIGSALLHEDDHSGGGVIISTECDNLRQRCIDFCSPNDPMCVEDCNNEAEACRSNQSTQGLEDKIEELKNERDRQGYNLAVALCKDKCYENVFSSEIGQELTPETLQDPEFQELLRNSRLCANECGSYK